MTRSRCSTPEDMPVCCRAVVGPEPLLDIRSEPPPPPAGTSPSSCSGCFASAVHLHMFYCTLPIYLSSNCQDKQFDLQTWTSCLNVSAHFNMEENILHPYGTDMWDAHTQRAFKQIYIMWCLLDYDQYDFSVNHMMERLMKKPHTFVCTHPTPPHPLLWANMGIIQTCTYPLHWSFRPNNLNIRDASREFMNTISNSAHAHYKIPFQVSELD